MTATVNGPATGATAMPRVDAGVQRIGAWLAPISMGIFGIGFWWIAGFIPPPAPTLPPDQIAAIFAHNTNGIRLGLLMTTLAAAMQGLWVATVTVQMYPVPEVMLGMGYGRLPSDIPVTAAAALRTGWGGAIYSMADAFGLTVDEMVLDIDHFLSPRTVTVAGGLTSNEGTIGAMRWSLTGMVGGRPRLMINHVNRMGPEMAPDWPRLAPPHDREGGYRIEIDGFPPYRGEFPLVLPGGTGFALDDAVAMTAARCVNAVEAVVGAAPGYRTVNELPAFGARYGFRA